MSRTPAELAAGGNPFRELEANAKILMPQRSETRQRRWVATGEEPHGLGTLDVAKLASYGLVAANRSVRTANRITSLLERWIFPESDTFAPAEVGRVDIARHRSTYSGTQRTTAVFMSPAMDDRIRQRVGVRVEVNSTRQGPYDAKVQLLDTTDVATGGRPVPPQMLNQNNFGAEWQKTLDGGPALELHPAALSASHAVVPLVANGSQFLAELAAGNEFASWVPMLIDKPPALY